MRSHSVYKVPAGKLLKVSLEYDQENRMIKDICITGDFFAYPEEAVELMETALRNTVLEQEQLLRKISSIIARNHIQFIGLNAEGLTHGIMMCVS